MPFFPAATAAGSISRSPMKPSSGTRSLTPYLPPRRPVLVTGHGGQPKLRMQAADGACAEVYLHGGQVTSWRPAGGEERLFLSERASFAEAMAIRGGVPVIFPQFGADGRLPRHGFARVMDWSLMHARELADGGVLALFRLTDNRLSWSHWRHRFGLELTVVLGGAHLELRLTVRNEGQKPFRFATALHTYLRVEDIAAARLLGLAGGRYRDQVSCADAEQAEEALAVEGELDRIYRQAPAELILSDGARRLRLTGRGFPDLVVWNPGEAKGAALSDLQPDGYRRFLCVEPGVVTEPLWLNPDEAWQGTQRLEALG